MKPRQFVIAAAGGLIVYLLLTLFLGPSGFSRHSSRMNYHRQIRANIADLEEREKLLLDELDALHGSSDKIRLLARELGYYEPLERRIVTRNNARTTDTSSPGRLVSRRFEAADPRPALRLAALVVGAALLVLQLILDSERSETAR